MNSPQENLRLYLHLEEILNDFFGLFNFCMESCIPEQARGFFPAMGCCKKPFYREYDLSDPGFDLLRTEREKRYGKPEDCFPYKRISPCEYHTPEGCRLLTHKSPVCLSFLCKEGVETLRKRYGIYDYDYLGIHYGLEWTLTGAFSGIGQRQFYQQIKTMYENLLSVKKKEFSVQICTSC